MFPTEGDRVCSWLLQWNPTNREHCAVACLQKGPSVPPLKKLGLASPAFAAAGRQKGTCRVDVSQQALQNKPPPISISTHPPHSAASQQPAAFPANSIPMTACQQSALSQREERKKTRGGEKWREERSRLAKGKLLKDL